MSCLAHVLLRSPACHHPLYQSTPLTVQSQHSKAANADKLLEERMQTLPAFDSEQVQYQNRDAALRLGLLAAKIVSSASA